MGGSRSPDDGSILNRSGADCTREGPVGGRGAPCSNPRRKLAGFAAALLAGFCSAVDIRASFKGISRVCDALHATQRKIPMPHVILFEKAAVAAVLLTFAVTFSAPQACAQGTSDVGIGIDQKLKNI